MKETHWVFQNNRPRWLATRANNVVISTAITADYYNTTI